MMTNDMFEGEIEAAYWEFDHESKKTGAQRDAFKHQLRRLIRKDREQRPLKRLVAALMQILRRIPFGFRQEDFRTQRSLMRVWGLGRARWEVWRWPPEIGINESAQWLNKLTSPRERYSRLGHSAELVLRTTDWRSAQRAMGIPQ